MFTRHQDVQQTRFIIQPNCSMSWQQVKIFLLCTYLTTLIIVTISISVGLWLVIPFAGLEMLLLTACFYHVARNTHRREVITITPQEITIESGWQQRKTQCRLPCYWVQVQSGCHCLTIGCHQQRVEVGHGLVKDERQRLATALKQALQQAK